MKNFLIITGLDSTQKIGGLERWYIKLSTLVDADVKIFLLYNEKLPEDFIIKKFESHNIYSAVFAFSGILENLSEFNNFLINNNIGIVWAHFENTVHFLPHAKKMGMKTLWTLHMGNYYSINSEWRNNFKLFIGTYLYRFKMFTKLYYIDKIYCVSKGVMKEFKNFFGHNDKFEVNYLGVERNFLYDNLQKFRQKEPTVEKIVITCIAFHGKVKGVDIFIKAISELNKRGYTNVEYYQIGGGQNLDNNDDTRKLHDLANSLQITNLTWHGFQKEVVPYLLNTSIYCQPSRHEALSFSTMEAMSVGLPVVASNTCGLPELVHHSKNGFLFESESFVDLADKLEILINDIHLRKRMGEISLEIINQSVFNSEYNIRKILSDLNKV